MKIFQNYHRHSRYTNIKIADSVPTNEAYAKRASELGHGIISTMEHGFQGRYIEGYELAKEYNLKFVFGTEAYWVKDRFEKDSTNAHICIFARNENGRQSINDILAEANISGIYYQARLDLNLIYSLNPKDVIITSACVGFWKYKEDKIVLDLYKHFKDSFLLEVQYHATPEQRELNKHIISLSNQYTIPIIMGCDSHYIDNSEAWERDEFIKSKGIKYEDEKGWYLDYPDGNLAYKRFIEQKILTKPQIEEAMDNTNVFLTVEEYNNPCFSTDIKMPTLYPELSQDEKNKKYINLIWSKWDEEKHKINKENHKKYIEEIQKEINDVLKTKHADYFLLDYELVKESVKRGGMITLTGRGSCISYYTTKLLGLTKVDRISAEVKMYPERFISPTRIIESKSLADIDLNWGNPEIAAQIQKELLGEECTYPMIAYGTMKAKSAWNMYAKAKDIKFELAQAVSNQIEQYEKALKHAEEDEIDEINIFDYVDEQYHEILKDSEKYLGLISDVKVHACGHLIYQGNIRKEIGLIKTKSKSSGKEILCTLMDGKWAEKYAFMKNDLLKVSAIELIYRVYERINQPVHDVRELIKLNKNNQKTWSIYKNGYTIGINQVEQNGTKHRVMKYAPQNISELCAFIAAIRPGFKSMFSIFANRENFTYDIPIFDNLIQTPEMPASFVLYQEMAMTALNFAGIPMSECYEIIKCISKKRVEKIKSYKDIFLNGFAKKIIEDENKSQQESEKIAEMVWQIISDSSRYSFNSSHSYCVSADSLYGAYLKSHYPLEFYETFLRIMNEKGNKKDRMSSARKEAEKAFQIRFDPFRFRQDNRNIVANKETNTITNTLKSLKSFGAKLGDQLYSLKDNKYNTFVDLLIDMEDKSILCAKIESLIKIQYFDEFGNNGKLLAVYKEFTGGKNKYDRKHKEQTKIKRTIALKELEESLLNTKIPMKEQMDFENEILGYIQLTYNVPKQYVYITNVNTTYSPRIELYCLKNGNISSFKVQKRIFAKNEIKIGDIISLIHWEIKKAKRNINGKWIEIDEEELWVDSYNKVENIDNILLNNA